MTALGESRPGLLTLTCQLGWGRAACEACDMQMAAETWNGDPAIPSGYIR